MNLSIQALSFIQSGHRLAFDYDVNKSVTQYLMMLGGRRSQCLSDLPWVTLTCL